MTQLLTNHNTQKGGGAKYRYKLHTTNSYWFVCHCENFPLHHHFQNGSGAHTASYPRGINGSFPGSKAAEA